MMGTKTLSSTSTSTVSVQSLKQKLDMSSASMTLDSLTKELKSIKYLGSIDEEALKNGRVAVFLPLFHYILLGGFSRHLSSHIRSTTFNFNKENLAFVEEVFAFTKSELDFTPPMTASQFFAAGGGERKMQFLLNFIRLCKRKHNTLMKNPSGDNHTSRTSNHRSSSGTFTSTSSSSSSSSPVSSSVLSGSKSTIGVSLPSSPTNLSADPVLESMTPSKHIQWKQPLTDTSPVVSEKQTMAASSTSLSSPCQRSKTDEEYRYLTASLLALTEQMKELTISVNARFDRIDHRLSALEGTAKEIFNSTCLLTTATTITNPNLNNSSSAANGRIPSNTTHHFDDSVFRFSTTSLQEALFKESSTSLNNHEST